MPISFTTLIGLFAATCTTAAYIPQALKTLKTKKTQDISFWTYLVLVIGVFGWLVYGILLKNLPIILANSLTLIFTGWIFALKIRYQ